MGVYITHCLPAFRSEEKKKKKKKVSKTSSPSYQPFAASPETPSVRRRQYNSSMQVELICAGKAFTLGDGSLTLGAQRLQGLFHSLSKVLHLAAPASLRLLHYNSTVSDSPC